MSQAAFRIHLSKESHKFTSAHMTVFPDGSKEALHGHNYSVSVALDLKDVSLGKFLDFRLVKEAMRACCEEWDEKVLIAARCPFFKIKSRTPQEIDFDLCGKHYVLPGDEVLLLEVDNIITETLAKAFCERLVERLEKNRIREFAKRIDVRIDETQGQGASYSYSFE